MRQFTVFFLLKCSPASSHVNVELKTNVSEISSASTIRANHVGHISGDKAAGA
jgi:hypothetical protein